MNPVKKRVLRRSLLALLACGLLAACHPRQPPVQVVYRFDEHRWLELKGWHCEGELWFVDQKNDIRSQIYYQSYRIFTRKLINTSERYMAVPIWGEAGMRVSKDYGKTWQGVKFKGDEDDGTETPSYDDIVSVTVVNDQGFLLTRQGRIYMSSHPFDDPRLAPGGPGIDYSIMFRGKPRQYHISPRSPGRGWGLEYIDPPRVLNQLVYKHYTNFQNLPEAIPEVKDYRGWTHMRCDLGAGLE
ncbi:T6SS immunity protein Tli3 family protein [Mangrovibacter yixingensis]|uniref:T6SS immunity protein Tli3 family protein n=1 Tax=Mangrovibacter yixingensis TaxID=1529639 RepID=UPI001CF9B2F4|nr:hypothetical protein [Mangrovibacter yixingensis]